MKYIDCEMCGSTHLAKIEERVKELSSQVCKCVSTFECKNCGAVFNEITVPTNDVENIQTEMVAF